MTSGFFDPNNHVPEVSPDDDWGDTEGHLAEIQQAAGVLPPRRSVTDRSSNAAADGAESGLRIEPRLSREEDSEFPSQLEVQEINGTVVRLEQDEPAQPKVDRVVAFHEKPERTEDPQRPRGEGTEWGRVKRGSFKWIYAMGIGVAAAVVLGIAALPKINAPNAPRKLPGNAAPMRPVEEKPEGIEELNRLLTRQPEAMQIFRAYVQAAHPDEVVPLIRDGAALNETLRKRWEPMRISSQWEPAADSGWSVTELEGHPSAILDVALPDHSRFKTYFVADKDQFLIDWKATTAYGTSTFDELKSGEGDGSEIRGEISVATFYTSVFTEAAYQSLRLMSPDGESSLWCYTATGSDAHALIVRKLQPGSIIQDEESKGPVKITVCLERGPEGALPNQWVISQVHHFDWVSP